MKYSIILFGVVFSAISYGQDLNDTIKVIAKLNSPGQGSKIHIAEYEVIKTIKGKVTDETILVGYYPNDYYSTVQDTVLLNLTTYTGSTKINNYYIFPNYNPKLGINKTKISTINYKYWEFCETENAACKPLTFTRKSKNENWFLFMPCGGTQTDIKFIESGKKSTVWDVSISLSDCPPILNLANLADGKYYANMVACNLGGSVEINLKTER